jgi:nitrite reductase (NADH) small subunit
MADRFNDATEIRTMMAAENLKVADGWIEVGKLDAIPRLGARVIHTPDGDVAVFRTADDEVFALRDKCPHKGGPLSQGIVYGKKVACPLHNWSIHLDSGQAVEPDEGCTGAFPVKVVNGQIYLSLKAVPATKQSC